MKKQMLFALIGLGVLIGLVAGLATFAVMNPGKPQQEFVQEAMTFVVVYTCTVLMLTPFVGVIMNLSGLMGNTNKTRPQGSVTDPA